MSSFYYLIKREIEANIHDQRSGEEIDISEHKISFLENSKRLFSEINKNIPEQKLEDLLSCVQDITRKDDAPTTDRKPQPCTTEDHTYKPHKFIGDVKNKKKMHNGGITQSCKPIEFNHSDLLTMLNKSNIENSQKMFYQHVLSGIAYIHENYGLYQMNKQKYVYLEHVYNNIFTHNLRESHLDLFYHIQKIYHGFSKLARLYKYRKAHIHNTCDLTTIDFSTDVLQFPSPWLTMSSASRKRGKVWSEGRSPSTTNFGGCFSPKEVWSVLQNGSLYFFNRRDLTQLLDTALGNAPYFFAKPLKCKNPYNNVFFTKADLYNMYFFIRSGGMKISSLIHEFYMCEFQLDLFKIKNEYHILEYAINILVNNGDTEELHEHVIEMLETYMPKKVPHEDFPKENLVDVMRPYLVFYLYIEWISYRRKYNLRILLQNLHNFYRTNPQYGRKMITKTTNVFDQDTFSFPLIPLISEVTKSLRSENEFGQGAFTPSHSGLRPPNTTNLVGDLRSEDRRSSTFWSPDKFGKINIHFITNAVRPPIILILPNTQGH